MNPALFFEKKRGKKLFLPSAGAKGLFLHKRFAVSAFALGGVCLVGANRNGLQSAVVLTIAVICAVAYSTADAAVCVAVHSNYLRKNSGQKSACNYSFPENVRYSCRKIFCKKSKCIAIFYSFNRKKR